MMSLYDIIEDKNETIKDQQRIIEAQRKEIMYLNGSLATFCIVVFMSASWHLI